MFSRIVTGCFHPTWQLQLQDKTLKQGSQTRHPRGHFVQPTMLLGNFQIININVFSFSTGV